MALAPYGIAVATVAPGFVATDMTTEHLQRRSAVRRSGRRARSTGWPAPEEIAAAVHWLASPEAEWASGTILDLNGASYLRS